MSRMLFDRAARRGIMTGMRHPFATLCMLMIAGTAAAEGCPEAPDHSVEFARLVEQVRAAPDAGAARLISNRMWELWADAPDEPAQALLDDGMKRRSGYDFLGALEALDRLVEYCPDYAEGYNQRAFVNFLRQDFPPALVDLDRALELSPTHIGALAGRAMTLMALGRNAEAQNDLRVAVDLNPWLPERGMLTPESGKAGESDL